MKKKLLSMALSLSMVCSAASGIVMPVQNVFAEEAEETAAEETAEPEETVELSLPSEDEGYTIGISVLNLTGQFFIQLVEAAEEECEATGCTLMTSSCDSDSAKQISSLENFISAGCNAII